jgi:hypothetical protein
MIACDGPPDWLIKRLPAFVAGLSGAIHNTKEYPVRAEIRNRLMALAKSARLVERELCDSEILSLLRGDDPCWTDEENAIMQGLASVASLADLAAAKVRKSQGKDKHWARPEGLAPMTQCALIVTIMWNKARGCWPGKDNEQAQCACEALWRIASGGPRRQSVAVWRDHLRDARAYRDKPEGKRICCDLSP